MKVGYFADGQWSHETITRLLDDPTLEIAFICPRNDKPDPVLKELATSRGIDFLCHPNINCDEFVERLTTYECDLFVSMSFNQIFRPRTMNLPKLGAINCHAGKLPFYRGRNVLNWALINDEREFGITVHHIDQGIDTGDIIMQQTFPITDDDTYSSLLNQAYVGCAVLLYDSIKALQSGTATRTPQRDLHPCGFYCVIRREGDERLNWNQPSRDVFNFIRAIGRPGPEARTFLCGAELRISRAVLIDEAPAYRGIPGSVLSVESDGLLVKTADSFIKVVEWSGPKRVRNGHRFQ